MFRSAFLLKSDILELRKYFVCSFLIFLLVASTKTMGQGNLLVSPKRLVFDETKKNMEINLANTGKDTARYLVSIMEIRMTENGSFEEITVPDSGQNFASKNLRFFPRTVTLGPNEAQTVKVQLIKSNLLAPGEYRSHIYFRAIPNEKPLGEGEAVKDTSIVVKLTPVFGITIPVIIRVGESTTKVNLSDVSLKIIGDTIPRISMALNRTGNMSAYGNIVVELVSPNGKVTPVGAANGVSIYTPNHIRRFQFDLDKTPGINYHAGKLHISYTTEANNSPVLLAETEYQLK